MTTPLDQTQETLETIPTEVVSTESEVHSEEKETTEEFTISGDELVAKVKELLHQGNIRRIILKNEERTLIEIPLTVGVVGGVLSAALFPVIAAVGVIGAMVAHLTIVIEKKE
jgi:CBS domain-containing protein